MTRPTFARLQGLLAERDALDQRITQLEANLPKKAVAIERVLDVMRKYEISVEELLAASKTDAQAAEPAPSAVGAAAAKPKASKAPRKSIKKTVDPASLNPLPGRSNA